MEEDLVHQVLLHGRGEHLVVLAGARVVVVLPVGDAPRVVGHEERRVEHPA